MIRPDNPSPLRLATMSWLGYAAAAAVFASRPRRVEGALFRLANGGSEQVWLRLPQQLGTPWALAAAALTALAAGRPGEAAVAALALPLEKAAEVATKQLVERPRPIRMMRVLLRDDAPIEGPSYPSGHVAIATAATLVAVPVLPARAGRALLTVLPVTAYVRVHQGAHHPGDAVGGALLGAAVVSTLRATGGGLRRVRRSRPA